MKSFLSAIALTFATMVGSASAQSTTPPKAKNVLLVHGAWADGSSWADVIPYLRAKGLNVTSVQNPLTSLADDAAAVRRALAVQDGPTLLVGHSYAGTVISEVGVDPKVTALVYVAARAPAEGEDFGAVAAKFPTMPVRAGIKEYDGFLSLSEEAFLKYFAEGLPAEKAKTLYAVQQPIGAKLFSGKTTAAAWKTKPSWYVVSRNDNTTSPDLQRFLAARMNAHTIELNAGHLSLVSHAKEIAETILVAAGQ
jgi:pimeloyl-ACP methyl ester carboxylesterase